VDDKGAINLPLVGSLEVTGMTTGQLESELVRRLKRFVKEPHVKIKITEFRPRPVSVLGQVQTPGVQQARGRRTLYEVLSQAGGLKPDAGDVITITREKASGELPLANVRMDESGRFQVGEINARDLLSARSPVANIAILPNDIISVPRAELVYVLGEVVRSGGFILDRGGPISLLQALSMAGGTQRLADLSKARVLRLQPGSDVRQEIAVDLRKILSGKGEDIRMKPEDILYIPHNTTRAALLRASEIAASVGTGIAIYRAGTR
jgi:polysaccharide export outer membrane protein